MAFSCVGSNVLPQITECGEVLAAALRFTVKRFPCVKPLMCFQPAKYPREMSHAEWSTEPPSTRLLHHRTKCTSTLYQRTLAPEITQRGRQSGCEH